MSKKSTHKENNGFKERFLNSFPKEDKDHIWEAFQNAEDTLRYQPAVTDKETSEALQNVRDQISIPDSQPEQLRISPIQKNWKWLVAASVLIIFGYSYLFIPQSFEAPHGEITFHALPDGSTIELNSGTEIQYNRLFGYSNRTIALNGEAFFDVKKDPQPFIVNAHSSTIEVTGTQFNVRSWSDEPVIKTQVSVSEGSIKFYPQKEVDNAVILNKGNTSSWHSNMEKPSNPVKENIDQLLSWRDRNISFKNKSLLTIFNELERFFDVEIYFSNNTIAEESLTAYYANPQSIESVLDDICRVKGLSYSKTADGYNIYR